MTDIVLVRHGETTWHADDRYAGSTDVPLNDVGRQRAQELAGWAENAQLAAIWSSDLIRCRYTAGPSAEKTGIALELDPRLRELDFGEVEGMTRDDIELTHPELFQAFRDDPVTNHMPGGEDPRIAVARGLACLSDAAAAYPSERILVVCHTTLIRLMICSLLGVPLRQYRSLFPHITNGYLNEIRLNADRVSLMSWNAPPHELREAEDL